jgi:pimeloyl-ACP methyl ester carboxylesterase
MKKQSLSFILALMSLISTAGIGHISVSYTDVTRNNREVNAEVYYPSTGTGEMTNWANGNYACVIFGHGFVMDYDAYQNIWEALVPEGYIVVLCTNETGFAPSHENFGLDLRFLANELLSESLNFNSFFYTRLTGKMAVAGHSMGGGASVLAASGSDVFDAYIGLAPAETNPSAIAAGANVSIPSLILSGSADAITPPDDHHIPIYEAITADCKMFVNLIEGSHCYFANSGSLCDLGEIFPGDMSQQTQQEITHTLMLFWLDYWLTGADVFDALLNYAETNTNVEISSDCTTSVSENQSAGMYPIWPNPASDEIAVQYDSSCTENFIFIQNGRLMDAKIKSINAGKVILDISHLAPGLYLLGCNCSDNSKFIGRVIVQ